MAPSLGSTATQMPELRQRRTTRSLIRKLRGRRPVFNAVSISPQAGMFRTFSQCRLRNLLFLEEEIIQCNDDVEACMRDLDVPIYGWQEDPEEAERKRRDKLREKTFALIKLLQIQGDAFEQYRWIISLPKPTQYFADFHRAWLKSHDEEGGPLDKDDISRYGQEGQPILPGFVASHDDGLNPLETFLAYQVMNPLVKYFWDPFLGLLRRLLPWRTKKRSLNATEYVSGWTIKFMARIIAGVIATVSLAIAIGTVPDIENQTTRITVITLVGLVLCLTAPFVDLKSMGTFILVTSYFQTMVGFVHSSPSKV